MDAKEILEGAFHRHGDVLGQTLASVREEAARAAAMLHEAVEAGKTLFTCGNGGSAADAQHLVAEYTCKYKDDRRPLRAVALTANTSHLTAVGNDFSFDDVFSRQIDALANEGDVLVAITTSGSSKNILKAIEAARQKKMKTIVLTGERGAHLKASADSVIAVPSTETARIQEMHELIYHAWCEYVDGRLID